MLATVHPIRVMEEARCPSGLRLSAPALSVAVWVDAEHDLRMARGLARDGETYRPHWQRWAVQEQAHFSADRTRDRADVRVWTGTHQAPGDAG